jgi:hypothetical protein
VVKSKSSANRSAALGAWIGIVAALLSVGSAIYGVAHAQADLRERSRVVGEQLAAAQLERSAQDYSSAWESLQLAGKEASVDGLFAKLLGGLSKEQRAVRTAQEDLAMEWLRRARVPESHSFSEIVDKVVGVLSTGADNSAGARKADLLAHQGWAYFLKQREGDFNVRPDVLYREAVATDATNPYGNAFWGHFILWNHGSIAEARVRFAAALASNRARDEVRHFELAALGNSDSDDFKVEWWRVIDSMHHNGEAIDSDTRSRMRFEYGVALDDNQQLPHLFTLLSPKDHVELLKMLLQADELSESDKIIVTAAMATALEGAQMQDESLAMWRQVQVLVGDNRNYAVIPRMNAALKRLSPLRRS